MLLKQAKFHPKHKSEGTTSRLYYAVGQSSQDQLNHGVQTGIGSGIIMVQETTFAYKGGEIRGEGE